MRRHFDGYITRARAETARRYSGARSALRIFKKDVEHWSEYHVSLGDERGRQEREDSYGLPKDEALAAVAIALLTPATTRTGYEIPSRDWTLILEALDLGRGEWAVRSASSDYGILSFCEVLGIVVHILWPSSWGGWGYSPSSSFSLVPYIHQPSEPTHGK